MGDTGASCHVVNTEISMFDTELIDGVINACKGPMKAKTKANSRLSLSKQMKKMKEYVKKKKSYHPNQPS